MEIVFQFDEATARRAAGEIWLAVGREYLGLRVLGWVAAATALLWWSITRRWALWWLLLCGAGPGVWLIGVIAWIVWGLWLRHEMAVRAGSPGDARVRILIQPLELELNTERAMIRLRWVDLTRVHFLRSFIVLHFRGGSRFPVPLNVLTPDILDTIMARSRQAGAVIVGRGRR